MTGIRSTILPWALTALVSGCASAPPEAARAQALLDDRRFDEADQVSSAGLEQHPREPTLWRVRVESAMKRGDHAAAATHYRAWHSVAGEHDRDLLRRMAMTVLRQSLAAGNAETRARAVRIIERHRLEPFAEAVADRLGDDDDIVAATAAVAILKSHPQAADVLEEMLSSPAPRARAIALAGLARKLGEVAADPVAAGLRDRAPEVRRAALAAWGRYRRDSEFERVVVLAHRDPNSSTRAQALRVLAEDAERAVVAQVAIGALGDSYVGTRLAGIAVLAGSKLDAQLPVPGDPLASLNPRSALQRMANGDDAMVAAEAAIVLTRAGSYDRGQAVFERHMRDPAWTVRASLLGTVQRLGERKFAMTLAGRGLADRSERVRVAAARLVLRYGASPRAANVLDQALGSADVNVRLVAAAALADANDRRASAALSKLAGSADANVQRRALTAHQTHKLLTVGAAAALGATSSDVRLDAADWVLSTVD